MAEESVRKARIVSVVAATAIAIACGTNYAYSAWSTEYADRLDLTTTQSEIIGAAGNIGMYASGIPAGLLIDNRGPRIAVLLGGFAIGLGYFFIYQGYTHGAGYFGVPVLSTFSFLTGLGSCTAFSAAIKTCAYNWPDHRGTATAIPLSGFGLSAFFFTALAHFAFPDNTGDYLLVLAIGTLGLCLVSILFIRLINDNHSYSVMSPSPRLDGVLGGLEPSLNHKRRTSGSTTQSSQYHLKPPSLRHHELDDTELSHGLSSSSEQLLRRHSSEQKSPSSIHNEEAEGYQLEISGLPILRTTHFYQLFTIFALLSGVGLMTINNVGNDAKALWLKWDPSASHNFIQEREQLHVSLLSIASFLGRLASGIGSDFLVKKLGRSRCWCLVVSAAVFAVAQLAALCISNPSFLFLLSCLTGLGYGALFGVFPALTADAFGVHGLSLNWGCMVFAPVLSGNVYNLIYGRVYDSHKTALPDGKEECVQGLTCYAIAYYVTLTSSLLGIGVALWCVRAEQLRKRHRTKDLREETFREARFDT